MIFSRTLQRELVNTAGAAFTALLTITLTVILVRILGQAALGRVATADVLALLGFSTLNYLPVLIVLAVFLSVLLVLSRAYRDSEMVVWFASGVSLFNFVRPVLRFALPLVALTALLSFVASPWALKKSEEFKLRYEQRGDLARVTPGRFQESAKQNRVFFVEKINDIAPIKNSPKPNQTAPIQASTFVENIFVSTQQNGQDGIVVANKGMLETRNNGERYLVLQNGKRYEMIQGADEQYREIEFERYGIRVPNKIETVITENTSKTLSTPELLQNFDRWNRGELLWRISMPLFGVLLALLAIPLSFINPRAGRSANLLVAILVYITYTNLVSVLQAWVIQDRVGFWLGLWPVHLAVALLVLLLFVWRVYGSNLVKNKLGFTPQRSAA